MELVNRENLQALNTHYPIDGSRDALWMHTAVPAPQTDALAESASCDVAIIGGGLTGLNAAIELSANGSNVVVLDAATLGFGASGRSGGQVNLGLNAGPARLLEKFGHAQGERLIELVLSTPQSVFDNIRKYKLDCDAVQNGWVQAAAGKGLLKNQQALAADYSRFGDAFTVLDSDGIELKTGAQGYTGGLHCAAAGSLHPLSYTRELARVAIEQGARVFTGSAVTGIAQKNNGWLLSTASAQLTANTVLVCTNGYTSGNVATPLKGLSRTMVPVRTILAATEPLSDNLKKSVLPNQITFVDKRRLILYFRYDRYGRLCVGNHGPMRDAFAEADFEHVKKSAVRVFPQIANAAWEFHWGGRVAVTKSGLPFMHEVAPGLIAGMGFNGRGIGMGTMMGKELARYAMKRDRNITGFPITTPKPFALHRFHSAGVSMSIQWFAVLDYLDSLK